uniref:Uncharacterized protein n=1 Tax=Cucumis melo TaxID=3656 RepID=A0A9I9EGB2_CUCME
MTLYEENPGESHKGETQLNLSIFFKFGVYQNTQRTLKFQGVFGVFD